jgi:hypothetical protein
LTLQALAASRALLRNDQPVAEIELLELEELGVPAHDCVDGFFHA